MNLFSKHLNIRVSLIYSCIASLWIVVSDTLLVSFTTQYPETIEFIHIAKGLLFVVVTTITLSVLLSAVVAQRTQIERELQNERDISPIGIAVLTPTGALRYANTQAEKILGLTRSAIIKHTYNAPEWHITDNDGNPFADDQLPFAQVMRTRQAVYGVQHAIQWADGRSILLEINAAPLFANDGSIHEVVATFNDVTRLHRNAKLLRESEATYRLLFKNNPVPMWVYDLETLAFLEVNDAAVDKYGYSQEEFLRLNLRDIRPPEDVSRLNADLAQLRPELQHSGEWRHCLKNGQVIEVEITSHTLEYGGRRAVLVLAQDISERKQMERQLRDSEERYRVLVEQSPYAIGVHQDGRIVFANQAAAHLLGAENVDQLAELTIDSVVHSTTWTAARERIGRMLQGETGLYPTEDVYVRLDGSTINVEVTAVPLIYRGKPAIQVIALDISKRKHDEDQIRYLANLIENVSDAIISTDLNLIIRSWNHAAETLYGWKADEVIGKPMIQIVLTEYLEDNREAVLLKLRNEGLWKGEVLQRHRDGTPIHVLSSVSYTFDAAGHAVGIVGVNRDIRERKQAQQVLQRYNQRLTILRQIDGDIISARSLEYLTESVLRHIRALIACERASVTLFEDTEGEAVIFALAGEESTMLHTQMRVPLIRSANLEVLEAGRVLVIADLQMIDGALSEFAHKAKQEGIRATLSAPIRIDGKLIGHLSFAAKTPNFFSSEHIEIAREISDQLALAFRNAHLLQHIQTTNQQLQVLSARLVEVQESERRHIARELHDEIGQTLTALSLMLDMQARHTGDRNHNVDLSAAQTLVSELTKRIRELSLDLRPSMLDDLGLIPALIWYFKRYEQQTQIVIDFKYSDVERRFTPTIETTVYRIIQEALTNIARYAQVDRASVRMWTTLESLHIQIADEGIGFDINTAQSANRTSGILGMRERAQIVGGECALQSAVGAGTVVSVSLPL